MSQTPTISSSEELGSLVSHALDTALSLGATSASVEVSEEKGTCVTVRNRETESIEHTHDRDFGITVYLGKSKAVASSGDFRKESILRTVSLSGLIAPLKYAPTGITKILKINSWAGATPI